MTKKIPEEGQSLVSAPYVMRTAHVTAGASTDNDVVISSTGVYHLFTVAPNVLVKEVSTQVRTAFTASVTLAIGDSDGATSYLTSSNIAPQSTAAVLTNSLKTSTGTYKSGKVYDAEQTIDMTAGAAATVAGAMDVYLWFTEAPAE